MVYRIYVSRKINISATLKRTSKINQATGTCTYDMMKHTGGGGLLPKKIYSN